MQERSGQDFPWGTLVVNITGSLLLGLVTCAALYHAFPAAPTIWLGSGFWRGYTPVSTFAVETVRLLEDGAGRPPQAPIRCRRGTW